MSNNASVKLYVGNLSVLADESQLKKTFSPWDSIVDTKIVVSDNSRSRRCYAIIEMTSDKEADSVIEKLNGKVLLGRVLKIRKLNA